MYKVMTNASFNGKAVWSKPNGPYGNAVCLTTGLIKFSAIRWEK